ncbi:hypothetical protein Tco_0640156 [Tanacetum coccineum]
MECLIDDMDDDFFPLLPASDSTLPEESSESFEFATLMSFPFGNKDKVFNPGILILGGTQIFHEESKDKDLKLNSLTEALLILVENNFLSHSSNCSSDRELLFFLESTVIETLLPFSSKNEDKVFNPGILISKGVHSFTLGLSHRTYETLKIINVHTNILIKNPMKIFPFFCFCPKDKGIRRELVPSCFAIFTFEPLTLSLTSMPSCDLESLTNILILCLILKASNQSLRKSLSLNLELS